MRLRSTAALALLVVMGALGCHAARATGQKATLSIAEARRLSLEAVPGTVVDEELEEEKGVLIYSFVIRPAGAPRHAETEVNLDATTGKVLGIEVEHRGDDADDKASNSEKARDGDDD